MPFLRPVHTVANQQRACDVHWAHSPPACVNADVFLMSCLISSKHVYRHSTSEQDTGSWFVNVFLTCGPLYIRLFTQLLHMDKYTHVCHNTACWCPRNKPCASHFIERSHIIVLDYCSSFDVTLNLPFCSYDTRVAFSISFLTHLSTISFKGPVSLTRVSNHFRPCRRQTRSRFSADSEDIVW